ncbi:iron ABC transporter substrate-binding protein [Streptomyces sp. ACA25]|uniref:iron ABC transporter substrate-binding protein n=1 Tax=Streptomyces sp. ACA25 TaxID=3022596 RepID=UPI002307D840|nr:iron ABC transporter substrate-binding protein [Streptomyces sp. ACA25]MDB1089006.1 iron ABC transporter substrate-binding protein [Streptomyces sp. ACA25]
MRRHRRLVTALAGAALLIPAVAACGSEEQDTADDNGSAEQADEAGEGSELLIYSGRNEELVAPLIDRLEEATGLEVTVRYGDSAELAAQLLEEGERTPAGLFLSQDAGALGALAKEGLLEQLPESALEEVDPAFRASNGEWVGVSGRARVLVYDPEQVEESELPDSVHELTEPQWKDKVGYAPANASFQAFVTGMRILEGDDATRQWLTDLQENGARQYDKNGPILDAAQSGEIAVGLVNHYYWYERTDEFGEESVSTRLHYLPGGDPGALINVAGIGVLAHGGQSAEAQEAVEFFLSEEAQSYFAEETKEYPLAAGVVSPEENLPPLESLEAPEIDLTDLDSLQQTLEMLQEVGMV